MKKTILDSLLLSLLLIFIISFPVNYFVTDLLSYYLIEICLRLLLILYYYFAIRRSGRSFYGTANYKDLAILSPVLIITVSNLLLCLIYPSSVSVSRYTNFFWLEVVMQLLTAISEEIVFRFYFHSMLRISNRLVRIIASAGIFAGFHLITIVNGFDPFIFIELAYVFGLGIVLGFVYEFGSSIIACIGLHFAFNVLNGTLFNLLFTFTSNAQTIAYLVINVSTAVLVGVYLLVIFLVRYRKINRLYFY